MPETPERSPIAQAPLSAILLAFNAEAELEEVISAWDNYLSGLARPYEIQLVDDGSTDDTRQRADRLAEKIAHVRVLGHEQHVGTGAALRTGLAAARHPLVFTVPCTKEFHPPDLYRVLDSIDQVDLVTGYRVGRPVPRWLQMVDYCRRLLARVFLGAAPEPRVSWPGQAGWGRRWLARWLFGVRVRDPECSYRLYRREILERLTIQSDSAAALIEILAKANHLECLMAEVPVSWVPPQKPPLDPVERKGGQELRLLFFQPVFKRKEAPQ
jgi:glycosyltransferase involved in cell wall biosynthesis